MSNTIALHARYKFYYISSPSSVKQQREMNKDLRFSGGRRYTKKEGSLSYLERCSCQFNSWIKGERGGGGVVSKETAVLRQWGGERNVWFINRVDNER